MTYRITTMAGRRAIQCLLCGRISELPGDVAERYCGRCHLFHDTVAEARRLLALEGGTHECEEWKTYRDECALCGLALGPRASITDAIKLFGQMTRGDLETYRRALELDRANGAAPGFCQDRIVAIDRELAGRPR